MQRERQCNRKDVPMTVLSKTRAIVVRAPNDYVIEERNVPEPGPGEVLVKVAAAGICGSDIELFEGTRPAPYVRYPVIPGHEWAGVVAAVGPDVTTVAVDDPVVAQGFRNCGTCARCREGATNLCTAGYAETGFTEPGAFSGYVLVPARLVHRLRPDADVATAALLEPSACVVEGLLAGPPIVGSSAAVIGTGTLSLVACQLLARLGAREIVVVGDSPGGRELAEQWGATACVSAAEAGQPGWSCEADFVFESAGRENSARLAFAAARRGGTVVLEGIPASRADGDPTDIVLKHLTVRGVFGASAAAWEHVVTLFNAGLLDVAPLVSHRFNLTDVGTALNTLRSRQPGVRKVLLEPDDADI